MEKPDTVGNYYQLLEVSPDASSEEISTAYRRLMRKYQPSKYYSSRKDAATTALNTFDEAFLTLSDLKRRQAYDATLSIHREDKPLPSRISPRAFWRSPWRLLLWGGLLVAFVRLSGPSLQTSLPLEILSHLSWGKLLMAGGTVYLIYRFIARSKQP